VGSNTASNPVSTQQFLEQMTAQLDAADLFYGHGTDNGWDEACWLFETVLRRHGKADLQYAKARVQVARCNFFLMIAHD
jgi:hypothetical protein